MASSGTELSVLSVVDLPSVAMDTDPSTSGREKDINTCLLLRHENSVGIFYYQFQVETYGEMLFSNMVELPRCMHKCGLDHFLTVNPPK